MVNELFEHTLKKLNIACLKFIGNVLSMTLISIEKRLSILPVGVVSKKDIGLRNTAFNVLQCNNSAAPNAPMFNNAVIKNTATTGNKYLTV